MKTLKVVLFGLLALSVLAVPVVFAGGQSEGGKDDVIHIGSQRGLFAALGFIVKEKGYLSDYGIEYEWHWFSGGPQMIQAMKSGDIDFALPAGASPGLSAAGNGQKLHFIANMMWGAEVLVLRKDLEDKVDVNDPETIKGLKIAHAGQGSMQDYLARLWLQEVGVDPDDVDFREVSPGASQRSALSNGSIDIASTWEPHGTKLVEEDNIGVILATGQEILPEHDNTGFIVTSKALDMYKEEIVQTLKALDKALTFAKEKPEEMYDIVSQYFEMDKSMIISSFENEILVLPDNLRPGVEQYQQICSWLDQWGYTQIDSEDYLKEYLGYWEELQKEAGVY